MTKPILHLRSETKPLEHRSALTPKTTKALIDAGYTVNVERSPVRIFDDEEFADVGATLVAEGSWVKAPKDHLIIGLKELLEDDTPLKHTHVTFLHCYKEQAGWARTLSRFPRGGGLLYDLEFLADPATKRRIAAFGFHAGYAGTALALLVWAFQLQNPNTPFPSISSYPDENKLIADVKEAIGKIDKAPRIIIIGALGRCGKGAVQMAEAVGIPEKNILKWDLDETKAGGPFMEVAGSDVFINTIYLTTKIPPFVDFPTLSKPGRQLSVVCDVSCDWVSPISPIPIYNAWTTFDKPTLPIKIEGDQNEGRPLSVISIDHLPSLLPREASEAFSNDLLPHLLRLEDRQEDGVWVGAEKLFNEKVASLPAEYR